jgi:hypothetical protein
MKIQPRWHLRWLGALALGVVAALAAGCAGSGPVDLVARDSRMTSASVRVAHRFDGPAAGGPGVEFAAGVGIRLSPAITRNSVWLEGRLAGVRRLSFARTLPEVALVFAPVPQLRLRLGMAYSETILAGREGESDLVLLTRGPFAGLALQF